MAVSQDDKRFWDFYQTRFRNYFESNIYRTNYILNKLINNHKSGRVLEIGFGNGSLLIKLCDSGYECYGIDVSEKNVELTAQLFKNSGKNIILEKADISKLPFPDNYFECIIANEVLEHLTEHDLNTAVDEIYRCLKTGGIFIGTVPANETLDDSLCYCPKCGNTFHRWGHKQSFTKDILIKLFAKCFKVITIYVKVFISPRFNLFGMILYFIKTFKSKLGFISSESNYLILTRK